MKTNGKRIFALAALLLALCMALVACGVGGEDGKTETKPATATAAASGTVTDSANPPKSEESESSQTPQEPGKLEPGDGTHDTDDDWTDFY